MLRRIEPNIVSPNVTGCPPLVHVRNDARSSAAGTADSAVTISCSVVDASSSGPLAVLSDDEISLVKIGGVHTV